MVACLPGAAAISRLLQSQTEVWAGGLSWLKACMQLKQQYIPTSCWLLRLPQTVALRLQLFR